MKNKISVIIPVYNVEKYLKDCVNSVINQSYSNIEIILINDGSTDKSKDICDYFSKKDERIKVKHLKNGGVSNARNIGLEIATGDYVLFVDSDDMLESNMLELMINRINQDESDLCICGYKTIDEDGNIIDSFNNDIQSKTGALDYLQVNTNNIGISGYLWNKLYSKEVIKNIEFDINSTICEDLQFNCDVSQNVNKFSIISNSLYLYRQRTTSVMHSKKIDTVKKINAYPKIIECLNKYNLSNIKYKYIYIIEANILLNTQKNIDKNIKNEIKRNIEQYSKTNIFKSKNTIIFKILYVLWARFPKLMLFIRKIKKGD